MKDDKTQAVYISGVPRKTHATIKAEAARRGIKVSEMYILTIDSGLTRRRIATDG